MEKDKKKINVIIFTNSIILFKYLFEHFWKHLDYVNTSFKNNS